MNVAKTLLVVTAAGALLAGLTGCTNGGSGEALSPEDAWKNSPLSQYLNAGYDFDASPEEQQAESDKKQKKSEELVAECMAKEGFEYKPVDYSSGSTVVSGEDVEWEPDKKEWVAQYGYGVFNNPYQSVEEEQPTDENAWVDPNQEYVESLTESERTSYYEVLYGPQPTEEEMNDPEFEWEYDPENAGCQGKAQQEVWGEQNVGQSDEFKPLMDAVTKFYDQFYGEGAKPTEADKAWADCFAEAGYSGFDRQNAVIQSFYERQNKFYEEANPEMSATPSEDGAAEVSEDDWVDPSKSPEWKQVAEEEIETALADLECRQKTDYTKKQQDAMFAAEQKFVDEHKAELEAYKTAMEQAAEKAK